MSEKRRAICCGTAVDAEIESDTVGLLNVEVGVEVEAVEGGGDGDGEGSEGLKGGDWERCSCW